MFFPKKKDSGELSFYLSTVLRGGKIRRRIDINMFFGRGVNGTHQLRVGTHDLPPADIAALGKQLPVNGGREDGGDGKTALKVAAPDGVWLLLPGGNQSKQRRDGNKRLISGKEQAAVGVTAGGEPQAKAVALAALRFIID